ncbi:type IV secretion protein Rhs [Pseudomonas veronii]|uniref:Type IV secretion protein Rhs n=1 Tax=Pseudomonas veronii TaxID=76761 RepID=A0A7Y0ZR29_PSEVE|nr:RHS repeat-associated core domain-containing protein [Pseudomonas veronii]NMX96364.1 type IV secretion protein Rhs [Pseudomonas veronii]CAD0261634.1 RHS repeat-associated core domain protein-containing protein [Pseudomonas veronii]SEB73932.1 RHS repeat-associated core domain-containing protein [Pseudomonas marginalis]
MTDTPWAAREGDALLHSSMLADVLGGVLEIAANVAVTALATAAVVAAAGVTVATGGLGCVVLGAVVGAVVGVGMSKTGADKGLSRLCEYFANALFPPVIDAFISSGSPNVFINGKPAARAAGKISDVIAAPGGEPSYLDIAEGFFSQLWRPTVASPVAGAAPCPGDKVDCHKHAPMPEQYMAEGSSRVFINGQPAVRSGDRSTCEAKVGTVQISPNVIIGGAPVVVREIRSGKTPGVGLAVTALLTLRGGGAKFFSTLPCMVVGGLVSWGSSQVSNAITSAVVGSPNPVHSATGAKVLDGEDDLDFALPGLLPIEWQRYYSSRDERRDGLFGAGWSVIYEVFVEMGGLPEGGERLVYTDEQARQIDMGVIPLGGAVFSAGEGLSVRRHAHGQVLIESVDGLYRLFEPTPGNPSHLRLSQLGDRNDNRILLDYDAQGRLSQLRDSFNDVRIELGYKLGRVEQIERLFPDQSREVLASYHYDAAGDLAEVRDAAGHVQRRFAYDSGQRMVEHQRPAGLRCYYQWACVEDAEWRVVRHWTDEGDDYQFDYDLHAGTTRITDGLQRVSTRRWNAQYQITEYTDNLGQTWQFDWNDERQLLGATDPQGGQWTFGYDESGNLCETQDPLGRIESTVWLEHWSLPLVETDAAGQVWQYRYDPRGNCVSEIDPLGQTTRYRYDRFGQAVEIIDATGKSQTLRWNEFGQLTHHADCSGYPTGFEYDRRGHLRTVIDAFGEHVRYTHDPQGRLLLVEMPEDRTERYVRDPRGQLVAFTDAAGSTTRYQYCRRGQVRQRIDVHGRQIEFRYDAYGRLHTLTNENGEKYRFAWDQGDRLTQQQDLDGSARRYTYDVLDNLTAVEYVPLNDVSSIVHRLERDAVGRLLAKVTDDGRTEYAYDPLDQLTAVTFTGNDETTQALAFAYDPLGQLLTEQSAAGSLNHHYDELGNLIQTQLPDGRWLNRLYYGSGHLHQINLDGQVISDFERDRLHREVLRTQGQLSTRSEYDRSGRLRQRKRSPTGQPWQLPPTHQKNFEYDPADNLIGRREGSQHQLLHYDATARIIASQDNVKGQRETFAYDAAANLLDGPQVRGGWVRHNKLLTYQDKRYRYDGFGRLIEKRSAARGLQRFAYDAEHRLIEVRSQKNGRETLVNMTYDPLGRRITKTEHDSRGYALGETRFTWDGLRLLQEHRHSQTSLYLYEDDGYTPLARIDGVGEHQSVRYYHNDLNGLPEQLTEADGETVWRATYRVWGNTAEEVREPYYIEEQNLRFQGQYLDRETGLHYNTFRFYDPDIGRFTTPDPIGLAGGLNLYQYAPNPFGWVDPKGLACSTYKGKLNQKASQMHALTKGSKEWKQAVADSKMAMANGGKFQVKVKSSSDAKFFLKESQGNMNRYKAHTQSARADGVAKYPKGYEQHMAPEGGFGDTPHIKWYKNGGDGHIFYDIPN